MTGLREKVTRELREWFSEEDFPGAHWKIEELVDRILNMLPRWQPIETAPKAGGDREGVGPYVCLWVDGEVRIGHWAYDEWSVDSRYEGDDDRWTPEPTQWMPLTAPPEQAKRNLGHRIGTNPPGGRGTN